MNLIYKILTVICIVIIISIFCGCIFCIFAFISPSTFGYEYSDGYYFAEEDLRAYERGYTEGVKNYNVSVNNLLTVQNVLFENNTVKMVEAGSAKYIKINDNPQSNIDYDNYNFEIINDYHLVFSYDDDGNHIYHENSEYSQCSCRDYTFNNNFVLCERGSCAYFMDKDGKCVTDGRQEIMFIGEKIYGQSGSYREEIIFLN